MEDTLAPFTQTDAERQEPRVQQYIQTAGHINDLQVHQQTRTTTSTPSSHGTSGSNWDIKEVNAVRAIPLLNLPPRRIVPAKFFPGNGHSEFAYMRRSIQAASIDDLKAFISARYEGNPFLAFFFDLAGLITTDTSEATIARAHQRSVSGDSIHSDLSTPSDEDSCESASVQALKSFTKAVMSYMGNDTYLFPRTFNRVHFKSIPNNIEFRWRMAGTTYVAVNDGSVGCKSRHAGGIKRSSGEPEKFNPTVFAQEVGEMIGSVGAQRSRPVLIKHTSDQEAFVICMHGTLFYISAAYFSPEYIHYIETTEPTTIAAGENLLWIRRSIHFDLKCPEDRGQALKFFWALVKYIASGEARSNMVAAAIDAARDIPVE
ncbi:hypothetical protein BDQ94DRAFT_165492 [Aspergillus welwitschiae]|uniref:Uncharacterized protein n=1 Tax=Aspergillus welwitschiae TaxID=1341132 RepID=A0A3F3QHB2_9EURO|nr:hypothetical protein BDQ94DRAFT_165492 [Aspergillus welwitschiae]RDH38339.1 hypothetical protein BDQ94DRAFT_165492 [Aspergillus welwitschiae]